MRPLDRSGADPKRRLWTTARTRPVRFFGVRLWLFFLAAGAALLPSAANAEEPRATLERRGRPKPLEAKKTSTSRLLPELLFRTSEPTFGVLAIRQSASKGDEQSRRRLLALSTDLEHTSDPLVRVELARALRGRFGPSIDSALTMALIDLLDRPAEEDPKGLEALAHEAAAMALRRSTDPLAARALAARAGESSAAPSQAAARKALGLPPSIAKTPSAPQGSRARADQEQEKERGGSTARLLAEFARGKDDRARELAARAMSPRGDRIESRLVLWETMLGWLDHSDPEVRRATCRGLGDRLRRDPRAPEAIWVVGALAERYRVEPRASVRRALIASLSESRPSPARAQTFALAADLDADPEIRRAATAALGGSPKL